MAPPASIITSLFSTPAVPPTSTIRASSTTMVSPLATGAAISPVKIVPMLQIANLISKSFYLLLAC